MGAQHVPGITLLMRYGISRAIACNLLENKTVHGGAGSNCSTDIQIFGQITAAGRGHVVAGREEPATASVLKVPEYPAE